ncbi:MAG: AAA family ATPase [Bacteroidales bacterium]|nr:AAA family ATPase [Bacteroidales bacterium]
MRSRIGEIIIDDNYPFKNCKLGRVKYAEVLTKIVSSYKEGTVIAINGEWGSGKTTFIRMWKQYLENNGFKALYFNAWEDDFVSDPIVGLIGQFHKLGTKDKIDSGLKRGTKFMLKLSSLIVKNTTEKYLGKDIVDIIETATKIISDSLIEEIKNYENNTKSIELFREKLAKLVQKCSNEKPLVFIVDELDRCNPHYAVKVLERIKHLFTVENIVFVLSVDKTQLANSIRGYYGSDLINAEEYLKRFIDLELNLPAPNMKDFCTYLYDTFDFDSFFSEEIRYKYHGKDYEKNLFIDMSVALFSNLKFNLRQVEKTYTFARLVIQAFYGEVHVNPEIVLFLIYIRNKDIAFYEKLKNKELNIDTIIEFIEDNLPFIVSKFDEEKRTDCDFLITVIAKFLLCYSYKVSKNTAIMKGFSYSTVYKLLDEENNKLLFTTKIERNDLLLTDLRRFESNGYCREAGIIDLTYMIEHIELMHDLKID